MRFPPSSLVCGPPTPLSPSVPLQFPSRGLDPRPRACSSRGSSEPGRFDVRAANVGRVGEWSPGLRCTGFFSRETRASQVPGPSSSRAPWTTTPPDPPPLPISGSAVLSSKLGDSWTSGITMLSRPHYHGSRVRVPTHRKPCYQDPRKARYRLVGSTFAGQDLHLLDSETEFHEFIASPIPSGPALPGRTPSMS